MYFYMWMFKITTVNCIGTAPEHILENCIEIMVLLGHNESIMAWNYWYCKALNISSIKWWWFYENSNMHNISTVLEHCPSFYMYVSKCKYNKIWKTYFGTFHLSNNNAKFNVKYHLIVSTMRTGPVGIQDSSLDSPLLIT